jgi:hypothetical protein
LTYRNAAQGRRFTISAMCCAHAMSVRRLTSETRRKNFEHEKIFDPAEQGRLGRAAPEADNALGKRRDGADRCAGAAA